MLQRLLVPGLRASASPHVSTNVEATAVVPVASRLSFTVSIT